MPLPPAVERIYKERKDFAEGMSDIYNALASKALANLDKPSSALVPGVGGKVPSRDELVRRVIDNLQRSEKLVKVNEYTWLIKGFYEMRLGPGIHLS